MADIEATESQSEMSVRCASELNRGGVLRRSQGICDGTQRLHEERTPVRITESTIDVSRMTAEGSSSHYETYLVGTVRLAGDDLIIGLSDSTVVNRYHPTNKRQAFCA